VVKEKEEELRSRGSGEIKGREKKSGHLNPITGEKEEYAPNNAISAGRKG